MDTKLTLKLNQNIIEKAKEYARLHNTSLSGLIANYLQKITNENQNNDDVTPLVKSLSGVIDLPKGFKHKKDYSNFLADKYR